MAIKIKSDKKKITLPLNKSQGGIRICDKHGNHVSAPTKTRNRKDFLIEWMITNDENKLLADTFLGFKNKENLIKKMKGIKKFAEESKYSKRKTVKLDKKQLKSSEGFKIFQYTENFSSFEKILNSGIKVRVTFKLGDYGLKVHPHMYVLIPFNHKSLELKNFYGPIKKGEVLGKKCFGQWYPTKKDIEEIILTLAHASDQHRNDLVRLIEAGS